MSTPTPELFVRIWQTSSSAKAAAEALGMPRDAARARAREYRNRGIPLQKFPFSPNRLDRVALTELARALAPSVRGRR